MRRAHRPVPALFLVLALVAPSCGNDGSDGAGSERPTQPRRPPTTGAPSTLGDQTTAETASGGSGDLSSVHVELTEIASGLDSPVAFAMRARDDTLYIAEQTG